MNRFGKALAFAALLFVSTTAAAPSPQPAQQPDTSWQDRIVHQTGEVSVPGAKAHLLMGKDFYFIGKDDARKVLVEGWGNPPGAAEGVLGMVFPSGHKPLDPDTWGAVVTYEETGYVSDADARTADYDKLLTDLRKNTDTNNAERTKQGYPAITLIGWAERPQYQAATHALIWARELDFGDPDAHELNYDIRMLGRAGVLSLNVVSSMKDLASVQAAAGDIAATAAFDAGSRYADFKEGQDKTAGYGVAGLIAAGAGVAAAKKIGLLGLIIAFGKKGIVLVVAVFGGVAAWFRKRFGGKGGIVS